VAAYHNTFDVEAGIFASELLRTLGTAKWDLNPNFGIDARLSSVVRAPAIIETGVLVQATEHKSSQAASEALVQELIKNGFDARKSSKVYPSRPPEPPLIVIDVESRPSGPQGEAKIKRLNAKTP
jgi:hypothetical protein